MNLQQAIQAAGSARTRRRIRRRNWSSRYFVEVPETEPASSSLWLHDSPDPAERSRWTPSLRDIEADDWEPAPGEAKLGEPCAFLTMIHWLGQSGNGRRHARRAGWSTWLSMREGELWFDHGDHAQRGFPLLTIADYLAGDWELSEEPR